ncbi:DUF2680 domain-containing protein [Aquibacillus halophilus]|uniref:DUF2680 domain-containing protein n=1 Tax=Aquibacillus halophilus TaxID=930132 RepID=A0A6A8DMJ1_9BACI|nr:DUF2680 domain-containing protein [Aquibacillus halophilus]MRH44247.1 DUF2680 domain-containing protein [Aquibacillus halophilus]
MKKFLVIVMAIMMTVGVLGFGTMQMQAEEDHGHKPEFKDVKLSKQQLTELETLYENLINQRKGIINKYQEFGVLEEEDALKMKEHLDAYFSKIEEDGFIPKWDMHKHHEKKHKENE